MKHLLGLLVTAAILNSCATPRSQGTAASGKSEIRYARQSAGELESARQRVVSAFRGGSQGVGKLLSENPLCGPGCWSKSGLTERQDYIPVTSVTPTRSGHVTRDSAMVMSAKGRSNVARSVVGLLGTSPRLRPLTASELDLYWAVVPFDLKDPLFVAEANGHRVVVNVGWSKKKDQIASLEDLAPLNAGKILGN